MLLSNSQVRLRQSDRIQGSMENKRNHHEGRCTMSYYGLIRPVKSFAPAVANERYVQSRVFTRALIIQSSIPKGMKTCNMILERAR
jgi:hypothetical protein